MHGRSTTCKHEQVTQQNCMAPDRWAGDGRTTTVACDAYVKAQTRMDEDRDVGRARQYHAYRWTDEAATYAVDVR